VTDNDCNPRATFCKGSWDSYSSRDPAMGPRGWHDWTECGDQWFKEAQKRTNSKMPLKDQLFENGIQFSVINEQSVHSW